MLPGTSTYNRVFVNQIGVFPYKDSSDLIDRLANVKGILVAVNAEKILKADSKLKDLINANIGYCDGVGAVWALRQKGAKSVKRIPGVELWLKIIEREYQSKTFYLVGSTEEVISKTVSLLKKDFEAINIVGFRNGYIANEEERTMLIEDIENKKPDYVFVAMGSPKQEHLMSELITRHPAIYLGLGGSFDVYTGYAKRAPKLIQSLGLEWGYRLVKQPSRIKRYLPLIKFFYMVSFRKL